MLSVYRSASSILSALLQANGPSLSLAEALYESYAAACAALKGARLPAWGALSRDEQTCWTSATLPLQRVELRLSQQLAQAKSELAELEKRLLKLEKDRELELRHTRLQELLSSWRG